MLFSAHPNIHYRTHFSYLSTLHLHRKLFSTKKRIPTLDILKKRARDGIRTRDPRLGKAILHH